MFHRETCAFLLFYIYNFEPKNSVQKKIIFFLFICRKDEKEYALKQIEGTGISMSACREIAVSGYKYITYFVVDIG